MGNYGTASRTKSLLCARKKVFFLSSISCYSTNLKTWYRYSVLPALSLDGILYVRIVNGSFNYDSFGEFIDGLLDQMNPFPGPNSVILMDNCRIHKQTECAGEYH